MEFIFPTGSLASQVIVGFCDLDGSSLKALEVLGPASQCLAKQINLGNSRVFQGSDQALQGISSVPSSRLSSCCSSATLTNIYGAASEVPKVSIIAINAVIPPERQAHAAAAIIKLVGSQNRKEDACLYILASSLIPSPKHKGVHVFCTSAAEQSSFIKRACESFPVLPPQFQIKDNMLALLMHMAEVTDTRACFLLTPGHRPPVGSLAVSESREGAAKLVAALMQIFNSASTASLSLRDTMSADFGRLDQIQVINPWFTSSGAGKIYDNIYS